MATVRVRINRQSKTATFEGPGTFAAKDEIKKLGAARWDQAKKSWVVSSFVASSSELNKLIPDLQIEEEVFDEEGVISDASAQQPALLVDEANGTAEKKLPASYSVGQFTAEVRRLLKQAFPQTVFVHGVLSSVKENKDGRVFMDLAEPDRPDERISCVIWRDAETICKKLHLAGFKLEADLQVMFEAQVELNKKWAGLSLTVVGIVAEYTIAKLAAQREKTNERLRQEGIFAKNKELALPFLPRRLGLLTSAGGTVINDFRASLDQANFGFELFWFNCSVQGRESKQEILAGLKALAAVPELDAVLIFRGGGSAADLAVFNEYEVAKAVCLYPLPIVSAIGHQEDQCSVQDVSYLALGVPKDIGHFFASLVIELRKRTDDAIKTVYAASTQKVLFWQQRLVDASRTVHGLCGQLLFNLTQSVKTLECNLPNQALRLAQQQALLLNKLVASALALSGQLCRYREQEVQHRAATAVRGFGSVLRFFSLKLESALKGVVTQVQWLLAQEAKRLERWETVSRLVESFVDVRAERVHYLEQLVAGASPEAQLKRGFSLVRRVDGSSYVTSADQVVHDELVQIQFSASSVKARIE